MKLLQGGLFAFLEKLFGCATRALEINNPVRPRRQASTRLQADLATLSKAGRHIPANTLSQPMDKRGVRRRTEDVRDGCAGGQGRRQQNGSAWLALQNGRGSVGREIYKEGKPKTKRTSSSRRR